MRSFDAVKMVLDYAPKDLTAVQRLVLIQIAHKQPKCFATVAELAREIGIRQEKTVSKAVKVLESRGLIKVKRRAYSSNFYTLDSASIQGRETSPLSLQETPPLSLHATPVKQTNNKQINKHDFELFWEIYPRKENRAKAEKAFLEAIPKVSVDVLIAASQAYRDSVSGRELRFVKLACSWLDQECWLDDYGQVDDQWRGRAL